MRTLVFDSGSVISLATSNLLYILKELKQDYEGEFLITNSVKQELVDKPLDTKEFKLEALQVLSLIKDETLNVFRNSKLKALTKKLLELANSSFVAKGQYIKIVHIGEISSIAACILMKSDALVIDERTTRMLVENPNKLAVVLSRHLNTKIDINKKSLNGFRNLCSGLRVIRSVEIVTVAFEKGILDKYIPDLPYGKEMLLDAALWRLKLNGCSVANNEIEDIIRMEV